MCSYLVLERKIDSTHTNLDVANDVFSIGGFYAFILSKNKNVSLSVIARSNYEAVKQNGLHIESKTHGNHKARIDQGKSSISDIERPLTPTQS